ncbi:MAG TPA: glycosyltransferase family 4 protein [Ktedonobacterales bacterium]|nr:glycosyltransferase family 4 protein [Ktedonobacterales bacterium]
MHIAVAHSRLTTFGGGERATLELLRRLSRRHEVVLWTSHYAPAETYEALRDFPRVVLPRGGWLTRRPKAGAVVSHSFGAHLLALRHPAVIAYLHTLRSPYLRPSVRPDLLARRWLDRAAIRRAAAVLANSAYTASEAERRYRRPIEVVPPGVDESYFALPLAAGDYALYAGRLAPEKGVERLLDWSRDLPVDLIVAGTGEPAYVRSLHARAGARVRFRGPLRDDALAEAYAGARFLAFTPHAEELGLVVLEAMAAGKPVLAVAEGGLPELIADGGTGLLVRDGAQFAAAALRLCEDDALCLRLGTAARDVARAYTWDRYAARIEQLCEEHGS